MFSGDGARTAADALATGGGARPDAIRRARARAGGAIVRPNRRGGPRSDRGGDGEAGVGKSRLYFEFKAAIVGLDGAGGLFGFAWQGLCLSAGDRFAQSYFRISAEDDVRARREKVNGKF